MNDEQMQARCVLREATSEATEGLSVGRISEAAQEAGSIYCLRPIEVTGALLIALYHEDKVVREGAVLGIDDRWPQEKPRCMVRSLRAARAIETSPALVRMIDAMLEEHEMLAERVELSQP